MSALSLTDVTKQYGDVAALRDCTIDVEEGEIYGFLGPNGAGKSTTIDILLDYSRPTTGTAEVLGYDAQEETQAVHDRVGILPEGFEVYDRLTGRQHLVFAIESKEARDDPDALAERLGIAEAIDRRAGGYSKGMTQRLVLAMALVGDPEVLILDEPSSGLDPTGVREMREIIREERDRGATVFFSSHILEQVESVCDRVGILRDGHLVAEDTIEGLRDSAEMGTTLHVRVDRIPEDIDEQMHSISSVSEFSTDEETNSIAVTCDDDAKAAVLDSLEEPDLTVRDFSTENASLEDLFLSYTADGPSQTTEQIEEGRA